MVIQHNMLSMNTNRQLLLSTNCKSKSTEKLSSGYRINRASDDAAGLKISEKMRSQVRGLDRASDNAEDGISLIQTAEGALGEMHDILHRMRQLSVQAANDTNQDIDREAIQDEINALVFEVDRISSTTQFNKKNLLDGSLERKSAVASTNTTSPYIYINNEYTITYSNELVDTSYDIYATQTPTGSNQVPAEYAVLADVLDKEIVPQAVKKLTEAFPNSFGAWKDCEVGIGLSIVNNPNSSTLASVSCSSSTRQNSETGVREYIHLSYNLNVNTAYLSLNADGTLTDSARKELEGTILHEMTHGMMDEITTKGMVGPNNERFPLWFIEGMAQTAVGGYANFNDWVNGGLRIQNTTSESQIANIVKSSSNKLSANSGSASYGTGYLACMYLGAMAENSTASEKITAANIAKGLDKILKSIICGNSLDSIINTISNGKYTDIADFQNKFGDSDSVAFIKSLTSKVGSSGNGSVVTGDFTSVDLLPDAETTTKFFDLYPDYSKVKNEHSDDVVKIGSYDGSAHTSSPSPFSMGNPINPLSPTSSGGSTPDPVPTPSPSGLSSDLSNYSGGLHLQIGANTGQSILIDINRIDADTLNLRSLNMMSFDTATHAIGRLDVAINSVSSERSKLGAFQNRLEHTIANLDNTSENTQAAESKIRDVDMAKEIVEFSKNNILQQAGQSMLAQANQTPQSVLNLLK